jgi:hypothetical protein
VGRKPPWGICDRCGFKYPLPQLRREWTGLMVCPQDFDARPAEMRPPSVRPEGLPLRNARPEKKPIFKPAPLPPIPPVPAEDNVSNFAISPPLINAVAEGSSGSTLILFTVTRTGGLVFPASVDWAVTGTPANPAQPSDFGGSSYPSGTLDFAAGQATGTITISVKGDTSLEPDEGFTVTLSNGRTYGVLTSPAATAFILNDDSLAAPALSVLALSANSVTENSPAGIVIGAFLNTTGGSGLSLVADGGGRFTISSGNLVTTSTPTDYETAASYNITIRETLAGATGSPKDTTLTIAVGNLNDTSPNAFSFTDLNNVAVNALQTSNTITVAGLGASDSATASISGAASSQLQKNGGAWGAGPVTVVNGDTLAVRHTSSTSNSTAASTTLTIGATSDTFTTTTIASGVSQALKLGFNGYGLRYFENNTISADLFKGAGHISLRPSGADVPLANRDANGWPTSLPAGQTGVRYTFRPPESAGTVTITFEAGKASGFSLNACSIVSGSVASGVLVVTPSNVMPTSGGFSVDFTAGTGIPKIISALPTGSSATYSSNWNTRGHAISSATAVWRDMKATSVEANNGIVINSSADAFPTPTVTLANRATPNSADWSRLDNGEAITAVPNREGIPFAFALQAARDNGFILWHTLPWNAEDAVYDAIGDEAAAAANNFDQTVYFEVSNEVWNFGYEITEQASYEAQSLGLHDCDTGALITAGGFLERLADKSMDVFARIKARYVAAGADLAKFQPVFAMQNAAPAEYWAPRILDYTPDGQPGPLKSAIKVLAVAPYIVNDAGPATSSTDAAAFIEAGYDYLDSIIDANFKGAATAAAARGLAVACYEYGQSFYIDDATTRNAVQTGTGMYALMMHMFARTAAVAPNSVVCNFCLPHNDFSNQSFGILKAINETPGSTRPKYNAAVDFVAGKRKLIPLKGTLSAPAGAAVGSSVGTLKRRTPGSSVVISSTPAGAISIADPTAQVLSVRVADAAAFTSAGTIAWSVTETDVRDPSGPVVTTGSLTIVGGIVWSPSLSSTLYDISGGGLTATTNASNPLTAPVKATTAKSANGSFTVTPTFASGSCLVGFDATSNDGVTNDWPGDHTNSVGYYSGGLILANNGSTVATIATFASGDVIKAVLVAGKVCFQKNGVDVYGNSTTGVGGYDVSAWGNVRPAAAVSLSGASVTGNFTGW